MKKIFAFFVICIILFSLTFVIAQDDVTTPTDTGISSTDNSQPTTIPTDAQTPTDIESQTATPQEIQPAIEFNKEPGLTPDSALYFIDNFVEGISVGDNPEKALDAREEKIAEAIVMVEEGKTQEAQQVLNKALQYGDIVEKEASPEMRQKIEESTQQVQNVLGDLKEQAQNKNMGIGNNFDENIAKEKTIGTASELAAKIGELCNALAKLDPLQYADTCKSGDNSPKWIREQDKQLTKEQEQQAKIFFGKLSQCFENPEKCDCKGMGVQSFQDLCIEKSSLAIKCKNGDENSCSEMNSGTDPAELLPDYLISTFKQVEKKYMKSQFDMYIPPECSQSGAKTAEECSKVMFQLGAPQECLAAGYTGKSAEDEVKCKNLMFTKNAPQECVNAGINPGDSDAPRKCAKLMFTKNAPQECVNAGITGEGSNDDKKCRELMQGQGMQQGQQMAPKFNKNCNSITETNEKIKCYEEFYNNAQVNFREDFVQGISSEGQKCPDGICDEFEKANPYACPVDCGQAGGQGCQSQQQIESLTQDCKNRGEDARIENRGGCPWVVCISNQISQQTRQVQQVQQQDFNPYGSYNPYVKEDRFGQKCPDGVCDNAEKADPYLCPTDCGGAPRQTQQPQQNIQQPPQQPEGCEGLAPDCGPNSPPSCQNGNWVCPSTQTPLPGEQPPQEPITPPAPAPSPTPSTEPAPTTGAAIFWNYYYGNKA